MKKFVALAFCMFFVLGLSLPAMGEELLSYEFEGNDKLVTVTNTLTNGGTAKIGEGVLSLDGSYGLKLGSVENAFTVLAMVKVESGGETDTLFFKDMDKAGKNKWTGVLSAVKRPAFWTHGGGFSWSRIATGNEDLSQWCHVVYVENNAVGSLYVNGELIGSGNVAAGSGDLYLGATYWQPDAPTALIDDVKLYNHALSIDEILAEYEKYVDFENAITLPDEVMTDIELVKKIATKTVEWQSSDESVIDTDGRVTRMDEDTVVTLSALIDGEKIGEFKVTVLKKPVIVNEELLVKYSFDENDGDIIHDKSGNGNHAAAFGNIATGKNGARFDGADDYVKMPDGVLYGRDEITISVTFTPDVAQEHVFLYVFGNGANDGYVFLNPSRPDTNLVRFAATKKGAGNEKAVESLPGIRRGEEATVTVVVNSDYALMYVNGDLVMDGQLGVSVSELGETKQNYIAKSLYEADGYFAGEIKDFSVYGYCMSDAEVAERYKKKPEYANEETVKEYITAVSFENGINAEIDTFDRDDVKIGAFVLNGGEIVEFSVFNPTEEITLKNNGTVCVFAFDEETNVPGNIYVKGNADGFSFESVPGSIKITSDNSLKNGVMIVAGFDMTGTLVGVSVKRTDIAAGEDIIIKGNFKNATSFKLMYWQNLVSMVPAK